MGFFDAVAHAVGGDVLGAISSIGGGQKKPDQQQPDQSTQFGGQTGFDPGYMQLMQMIAQSQQQQPVQSNQQAQQAGAAGLMTSQPGVNSQLQAVLQKMKQERATPDGQSITGYQDPNMKAAQRQQTSRYFYHPDYN